MRLLLFLFLYGLVDTACHAQKLTFRIDKTASDTVNLARYLGPKLYYADTAIAKNGVAVFDGSRHEGGLMAVVTKEGRYFEFILDGEEVDMKVENIEDMIGSMSVSKSENNKIFYDYIHFMTDLKKRNEEKVKIFQTLKEGTDEYEKAKAVLKVIDEERIAAQKKILIEHPEKFIATMVRMSMDIDLPELPRDSSGNVTDSNFVYRYYVNHYWDNCDLKDQRIVRTPLFDTKLDKYFSKKGVLQIPDTISKYAQLMLDKMDWEDKDNHLFRYCVNHITNKYEESKIMGMDRVFVYMARNFYCEPNNKAWWIEDEQHEKICERAEKLGRTMIGEYSPPVILTDSTEENWISSYDIDAKYQVMYFWDPNCGHCKKVTPKLQTLYEKKFKGYDIEVMAIAKATGDDFEKWKKFIRENGLTFINIGLTKTIYNQALEDPRPLLAKTTLESLNYSDTWDIYSTPRLYLLDENKKIIAKQLSMSQLEEFIDRITGNKDAVKLFPIEEEPEDEKFDDDH